MAQQTVVWYVESKGKGEHEGLRQHFEQLVSQRGFLGAEWLSSPQQPGLALVASRWQGQPPSLPLAEGLRGWCFVVEERR